MLRVPQNIIELEKDFGTENECRDYLFRLRRENGLVCPKCGSNRIWNMHQGKVLCISCNYRTSITAGTIFENTKKPLNMWFRAIWYLTGQRTGMTAVDLQKTLGFGSYETAWTWFNKLRTTMFTTKDEILSGNIELDEAFIYLGNTPKRRSNKTMIIIAAELDENRIGRIRLKQMDESSEESIYQFARESIKAGSTVTTDAWKGYRGIADLGFSHIVTRSHHAVGDHPLPHCRRVAILFNRWLFGTLHGTISGEHLDRYLDEFAFRFNRKGAKRTGNLFYELLVRAATAKPAPYRLLKRDVRRGHLAKTDRPPRIRQQK